MADDRGRISGPELIEHRNYYWDLMPRTREAATNARDMIAGKFGITLPETVTLAGADAWLGDLPHKKTVPQRARQKLIAKQWQIKRPVGGAAGPRASARATRLEQPVDAVMHSKPGPGFPWDDVNDLLLIEGIAFCTTLIDPINWMKGPSLYGKDGKLASEYADLDLAEAMKANRAERDDHMARNLPFRQRAYSIRQCAPLWDGYGALEGLIVKTHWTAPQLRRKGIYVSKNKDGSDACLYPLGAIGEGDTATGPAGQIEVTEAYLLDDDSKPYISWCVDGKYTWKQSESKLEPHIIDLTTLGPKKDGALTRLPISWGWGLGWSMADLDERAMSFVAPFWQSWRNIDSLITSAIVFAHHRAFPILLEENNTGMPDADDLNLEDDEPAPQQLLPMSIHRVKGKVTELATQGPPPFFFQLIGLMLGENKAEGPNQGAEGDTGIAMSMAEAFESDALATIQLSALGMASDAASFVLEGAKVLAEAWGEPVRVYEQPEALMAQENPSDTSKPMLIEPGLIGASFDIVAVKKKVRGENPAVRQQNAGLVEVGLMSKLTFLEEDGYEAPEAELAQIDYEQIVGTEQGLQVRLRILEQYVSDLFVEQLLAEIERGQANQAGLPTGPAQGLAGPPPDVIAASGSLDGGQMPGLGVPDPYQSQLMGAVAGGLGTQALNNIGRAGGELPQTPLQLGVPA